MVNLQIIQKMKKSAELYLENDLLLVAKDDLLGRRLQDAQIITSKLLNKSSK